MTVARGSGPSSSPGPLAKTNPTRDDLTSGLNKAARIYRDEVAGRLAAAGAAMLLIRRGELSQAEADELVDRLVTRADQWMRVYEAEKLLGIDS